MNYTILAYQESYTTRCDGYSPSDFEFETFNNPEEAIQYTANLIFLNFKQSYSYSITVLYNGYEMYQLEDADDQIDIEAEARKIADVTYKEHKEKKEIERLAQIQVDNNRRLAADLAQLAELQKKYGQ